jgi:hypothetical protein
MGITDAIVVVRDIVPRVAREVVLLRLQVGARGGLGAERLRELFEGAVERGCRIITPVAVYRRLDITSCAQGVVTFRGTCFSVRSADVASLLMPCRSAVLMGATIGPELSLETERLMANGRMTEAMVLDAFGSEAVDELVNRLCRMLNDVASGEGLALTRRFSPGYGDWDLAAQEGVLGELDAGRIGISLSESCILSPEKSVTAIAGWQLAHK